MPLITSTPFKSQTYAELILSDNPTRYFRLGETSGAVTDEVFGHTGTWNGTAGYGATGLISNDPDTASDFNGASYIQMDATSTFNVATQDFAVEFWMSSTDGGSLRAIMDKRSEGPTTGYLIGFSAGVPSFFMARAGASDSGGGTTVITDGQPHYVVINFDRNANAEIWVDNVLENTPSISSTAGSISNSQNARLGFKSPITSSYTYFTGVLDEFAFYLGTTLSSATIAAHYNAGS